MNIALAKKFVRESVVLWAAIAATLFAFAWFRVWIVSEIDTSRFRQILELLPQDWRRFSPVEFDWLISYLGRASLTLDEPMVMLLIGIWTIVRGSDVVSGELNRGTMEMLLSQPVSRGRLFAQHGVLTVAGLAGLVLLIWLAMTLAVNTTMLQESTYPEFRIPLTGYRVPITFFGPTTETVPMIERVRPSQFIPGLANLFCFGLFLICYAMMFSSWDRFRWRTLGIVVGIFVAAALIKVAAMASEKFQWLQFLTFLSLYEPALSIEVVDSQPDQAFRFLRYDQENVIEGLGPLGMNAILIFLSSIFFLTGLTVFRRRDLPAPL